MRRSRSTIGFSKSSQVPFTPSCPRIGLEGNGFLRPVHERDGALPETRLQLREQVVARLHEVPPRGMLGFGVLLFGLLLQVFSVFVGLAPSEVRDLLC